jgi:putative transcriptional regulator
MPGSPFVEIALPRSRVQASPPGKAAMTRQRVHGVLFGAAMVLMAATGLRAAAPQAGAPADPPAGYLLIASAAMQDPRFHKSVVLLLKHDGKGAFGVIINKPVAKRPIAGLLAETGKQGSAPEPPPPRGKAEGEIEIYFGGPVQTELGFIVHSTDYRRPDTLAVTKQLAMTADRDILRDIGLGNGPKQYLLALGYAGWGAGQLDGEIARHDWFSTPADPELVFDTDRDKVWDEALARRTQEL